MATKRTAPRIDFQALQDRMVAQFRSLDPKDPGSWPAFPRYAACVALAALVLTLLWFTWLTGVAKQVEAESAKEMQLRETFKTKLVQAVNLEALQEQRKQVQQYVIQLEKQLPGKAEMDALLSDINQAGLGRSLQFDLFKPGQVSVKEYYAELPIALKVSGRYHDIGAFAADIANLSRIVTLNNLSLVPTRDGGLVMEATAKTFRYLDPMEVAAQRKAAAPGAKK